MAPEALYEHQEGDPVPAGAIDGTEALLGEDTLDTDWDLEDGDPPPPGFWLGTHNRDGSRRAGLTEEEYRAGERWTTVEDGDD